MNDRIKISIDGGIATVSLNRPEKHNGVDLAMLDAMLATQRQLRGLRDLRAVILRGEGPSFCSGLDFKSVLGDPFKVAASYLQLWWPIRNRFQAWSVGWRRLPVPVIALIHGNCFGAGLQLGLGADIRISRPDARLSLMEAAWGLVPDMGGALLLRELLPLDLAKELAMTGRIVSGAEALELGLVSHLGEDLEAAGRALAAEISTRSPDSVAAAKRLMQDAWRVADAEALGAERRWQRRIIGRRNQRIAMERNRTKGEVSFARRSLR